MLAKSFSIFNETILNSHFVVYLQMYFEPNLVWLPSLHLILFYDKFNILFWLRRINKKRITTGKTLTKQLLGPTIQYFLRVQISGTGNVLIRETTKKRLSNA